jgi:hypothetical protein
MYDNGQKAVDREAAEPFDGADGYANACYGWCRSL